MVTDLIALIEKRRWLIYSICGLDVKMSVSLILHWLAQRNYFLALCVQHLQTQLVAAEVLSSMLKMTRKILLSKRRNVYGTVLMKNSKRRNLLNYQPVKIKVNKNCHHIVVLNTLIERRTLWHGGK